MVLFSSGLSGQVITLHYRDTWESFIAQGWATQQFAKSNEICACTSFSVTTPTRLSLSRFKLHFWVHIFENVRITIVVFKGILLMFFSIQLLKKKLRNCLYPVSYIFLMLCFSIYSHFERHFSYHFPVYYMQTDRQMSKWNSGKTCVILLIFINDCPFSESSYNSSTHSANVLHYLHILSDKSQFAFQQMPSFEILLCHSDLIWYPWRFIIVLEKGRPVAPYQTSSQEKKLHHYRTATNIKPVKKTGPLIFKAF